MTACLITDQTAQSCQVAQQVHGNYWPRFSAAPNPRYTAVTPSNAWVQRAIVPRGISGRTHPVDILATAGPGGLLGNALPKPDDAGTGGAAGTDMHDRRCHTRLRMAATLSPQLVASKHLQLGPRKRNR